MSDTEHDTEAETEPGAGGLSDRAALYVSAVFGLTLAVASVWFVGEQGVWYEALLRVRPTDQAGGVGAGWGAALEVTHLNLMVDLVHYADILMGAFILLMVFVHWASFHRLAGRMRAPDEPAGETVVADGGEGE